MRRGGWFRGGVIGKRALCTFVALGILDALGSLFWLEKPVSYPLSTKPIA